MMSGTTPYGSSADHVPVRPAPVSTSSATSSTSYRSQISRTRRQYSDWGTAAPVDEPPTGSAMNAATVSGPARTMASSTASPLHAGQYGGVPLHAQRYA